MRNLSWGDSRLPLFFRLDRKTPVCVSLFEEQREYISATSTARHAGQRMVEVLAVGHGRELTSTRTGLTQLGARLRYVDHDVAEDGSRLRISQREVNGLIEVNTIFTHDSTGTSYRATTSIRNTGGTALFLQAVTSAAFCGILPHHEDAGSPLLWTAQNEWCAESRWSRTDVAGQQGLPDINAPFHNHTPRGSLSRTGASTWSSGEHVPVAVLTDHDDRYAVAWEIENNGPWRWELTSQFSHHDPYGLALIGPTEPHHGWLHSLAPGDTFTTVPVSIALSRTGVSGAIEQLNVHRRASRLHPSPDGGRSLVFNDYMNALMGDPTEEKLIPLIDAAREAGAQFFCIDAGWYDDGGNWWPSVGEWMPSHVRFGKRGLTGILNYIRDSGMKPGLWVEPEVIGIRSPLADSLPDECFMSRSGIRIVEHDRYFLDLRNDKARSYLDSVFDRLISEYGAEYFKLDYNVTPGAGPDARATSPGEGLLEHCRGHLEWFDALRQRHPHVTFEACSSGAQRMDSAILRRFDLQSTSDQQDYRLYPAIAASAPMSMPLEQAGNWSYPQSEMTDEQIAFNMVTGLSGRLYLSGNLDKLDRHQIELVREATALYDDVLRHHSAAHAAWPLGLPEWEASQVALASVTNGSTLVFVWNRDASVDTATLDIRHYAGSDVSIETLYPVALPAWDLNWESSAGQLHAALNGAGECARIIKITPLPD